MPTIPTQYMDLALPVVESEPGPQYATDINNALTIIDQHDHSSGKGVSVTPAGLNINADLAFGTNNATLLRSARFASSGVPLSASTDIGCIYVSGVDLYYNDINGNQVRLTQNGQTYPAPTIPGMTGGAAVFYSTSAQKFTFQSSTGSAMPAGIDAGTVTIRSPNANSPGVTLSSSAGGSSYGITLPGALPTSASVMVFSSNGAGYFSPYGPAVAYTLSGSGTFFPPPGYRCIDVQGTAGGAGGGGSGTSPGTPGSGGNTTFGNLVAQGGQQSVDQVTLASTAFGGDENISGSLGFFRPNNNTSQFGGNGGGGIYNGGGIGGTNGPGGGGNGVTVGAGGGGAGAGGTVQAGGGGNAGATFRKIIYNPSSAYAYNVGTSGLGAPAGGSGAAGGNGYPGAIYVRAYP